MRTLGKLLVIWGMLFPLITLPSIGNGSYQYMPVFDIHFGPLHMDYDTVLQTALFMVGIGLSLWALTRAAISDSAVASVSVQGPWQVQSLTTTFNHDPAIPESGKQVPLSVICRCPAGCPRKRAAQCSYGSASRVPAP